MDSEDRRKGNGGERGTGWRPVPDPTLLTTEALQREVGVLKDLLELQMASADSLMEEKFETVRQKFELIEAQRVEQKADAKEALAAALQAAKDAVVEQTARAQTDINSLSARVDTAMKGQGDQLDSLTGRVTVMEAIKLGTQETRQGLTTNAGLLVAFVGLMLSILLVAGDVLTP